MGFVTSPRMCLALLMGCCAIFLITTNLTLHYTNNYDPSRSKNVSTPAVGCQDGLIQKVIRIALLRTKDEPLSDTDKLFEVKASAASVRQTPSAECNRALSILVLKNQSEISQDAFGLSDGCLRLLLDKEVRFPNEVKRIHLMSQSLASWNSTHCFRRAILESEKDPIRERVALVKAAFDKARVPLILDGGSLVGSFRHHGFVPWDDDFDFRVDMAHQKVAYKIFRRLAKQNPKMFKLDTEYSSTHWKFYLLDLRLEKAEVRDFLLCLDIFFYIDSDPGSSQFNLTDRWTLTSKSLFFPLSERPFEGIWFPAPSDTSAYLDMYYGDVISNCYYHCYSNLDSVKHCRENAPTWTLCTDMHSVYPFVKRIFLGDTGASLEFQLLGRHLLQTVFIPGNLFHNSA